MALKLLHILLRIMEFKHLRTKYMEIIRFFLKSLDLHMCHVKNCIHRRSPFYASILQLRFCEWMLQRICVKSVQDNDKAVLCEDACQAWFHAHFVDVTMNGMLIFFYSEEKWKCSSCRKSDLPPFNKQSTVVILIFKNISQLQSWLFTSSSTVGSFGHTYLGFIQHWHD